MGTRYILSEIILLVVVVLRRFILMGHCMVLNSSKNRMGMALRRVKEMSNNNNDLERKQGGLARISGCSFEAVSAMRLRK